MRLYFYLLAFIACAITIGCTHHNGENACAIASDTLFWEANTDNCIRSNIDSIYYLPLMNSDKHMLTDITKLRIIDDKILISNKEQSKICVYTTDGAFLYEIANRGKGHGEYLEIANFTVTSHYIYILDNYSHKIHVYNTENGKHVKSSEISFVAWDLEAFDDNNFLFTMLKNNPVGKLDFENTCHSVWRTDSLWSVTGRYLPYDSNYYEMVGKNTYFTIGVDNKIVFHTFKDDGFYEFHYNGSVKFTKISFRNPIPQEYKGDYESAVEKGFHFLSATPFVTEKYIVTEIQKGEYSDTYLYDYRKDVFAKNHEPGFKNYMLDVCGVWNGHFLSYIRDFELYDELTAGGFTKAGKDIEDLIQRGGICLLVYTMQQ
ncbi:MAG: 6-bladed beta-propeller [Bacteroidaceae bacterium]|nr:6-bladed beta-propeller [Bacteroidaceae bacterium]